MGKFKAAETDSNSNGSLFNCYLNISIEIDGEWIKMPLNCAIPEGDSRNLSESQRFLRDVLLAKIELAKETGDESHLDIKAPIKGSLYKRKAIGESNKKDANKMAHII